MEVKVDFFLDMRVIVHLSVFCLQDADRERSGRPPGVPGRAGLSEQRGVTCWIKLEHDGICSSQMEAGVIFVCCTFTPLFHSTIKKSFSSKITIAVVPVSY